jgi:hypothetical protein
MSRENIHAEGRGFVRPATEEIYSDVYTIEVTYFRRLNDCGMDGLRRGMCTKMRQKSCIIMHVAAMVSEKVHYSAVFVVEVEK